MGVQTLIQLSIIGLFFIFENSVAYDPATCIQCRESHMCNPPECFCCRDKMPLQKHNIPQMVFFTFDDAVNPQVATFYRQLFSPKRTNPNGCPISMTLFVSHRNTVYGLVKDFYEKGMEIASHSVTHSHMNTNTFIREARKQKENLSKRAGIPADKIVGWRSPFLEPVGDLQPSVLKDLGYEYDATLTVAKKDLKDKAILPFTLDFGWPYDCKIKPCPAKTHKGFWEVPVVSVKDYLNKYDCVYVDGCNNPPPTEDLAYKFLWDNFQKYYTTNRAPMGINMHASWFYYPDRKAAMDRFIKKLVTLDDVYVVSIKQVIEWLRNPTPLQNIKTFQPWQCNANTTNGLQTGKMHLDGHSQRHRSRQNTFRPQNTRIGNFISNVPKPSFPSRPWQTPRPQRRQPFVPTTIPAPVPPMARNHPMVRFWWRPPNMVDPIMQRNMQIQEQQRQETLRRRRLEEERLRRIKAEEQAKLLEKKRQEELRQHELARQAELLKKQNEMERKRLEDLQLKRIQLEKQRQLEAERLKAEEARVSGLSRKERFTNRQELDQINMGLVQQKQIPTIENLHQNEFLQISEINSQQKGPPKVEQVVIQTRTSQNVQDTLRSEFLPTSDINSPQTRAPAIVKSSVQNKEFKRIQNPIENEFLLISNANSQQTSVPNVEQALVQNMNAKMYQDPLRDEFLRKTEVNMQQLKAPIVGQPNIKNGEFQNKLINEFHPQSEVNSQQTRAPVVEQHFVRNRFIPTPQTPQTTTIDQQNVPEGSFQKFISSKLDEILGYIPTERTKQLERLSIAQLRALQLELRNRLIKENLPINQNQTKFKQPENVKTISVSTMESQPIQNELRPENKPLLNEYHIPNTVTVMKVNEFQSNELVKQATMNDFSAQYTDPVVSEGLAQFSETAQSGINEQFVEPLQSLSTAQSVMSLYVKTLSTTAVRPTTTTTKRQTQRPTTTTIRASPTIQETSTFNLPTTTKIANKRPDTTTTEKMTTTTLPTTPTTQSTTPTTSISVSTEKKQIPVVQRWTVSQNMKVPWQRWITEIPGMTKLQTTTPEAHETINPTQTRAFTTTNVNETSDNSSAKDQALNSNLQTNEIKQQSPQPQAFVNAPMHFDINYDINGQNQPDMFGGISFNTNRFKSPVNPNSRSVHISLPEKVTETTTVNAIPPGLQEGTALLSTNLPKIQSSTAVATEKVTIQPQHTYKSLPNITTDEHGQPMNNIQFLAQDASIIVNKYILSGNETAVLVPDVTSQIVESVSAQKQPLYVNAGRLSKSSKCLQEVNCFRPDCVCKETSSPNGMNLTDTPQIVYITVDGSLNFHTYGKMRSLFSRRRKNPNGCRIKGTVFVTDTGSSYRIANVLRKDGVELAMMGVSSRPYTDSKKLKRDLGLQRKRISTSANITLNDVKGWRSPGFSPVGDEQFNTIANHSLYDSSLIVHTDAKNIPIPWPHTLDFGWNEPCEVGKCPRNKHDGVWEVPVIPFNGPKNSTNCEYIDACTVQPETKQQTVDYLMNNFNAYYKSNRAPFAIRLKQMWFHWYYRDNFAGLLMFLDKILSFGDVYITSVADTIEWMKSPKPLKDLKLFEKWKC